MKLLTLLVVVVAAGGCTGAHEPWLKAACRTEPASTAPEADQESIRASFPALAAALDKCAATGRGELRGESLEGQGRLPAAPFRWGNVTVSLVPVA